MGAMKNAPKSELTSKTLSQTGESKRSRTLESNDYMVTLDAWYPVDLNDDTEKIMAKQLLRSLVGWDKGKQAASYSGKNSTNQMTYNYLRKNLVNTLKYKKNDFQA